MDYQENTKQIFLCLETKSRDCDHLVTLVFFSISILPEKFNNKTVPNSVIRRITSMEYKIENITASHIID